MFRCDELNEIIKNIIVVIIHYNFILQFHCAIQIAATYASDKLLHFLLNFGAKDVRIILFNFKSTNYDILIYKLINTMYSFN